MKVKRTDKPWGYELLLARTEQYAGKILCIRAGHRLSLQHHALKDETLFVLDGETQLELQVEEHAFVTIRMARDRSYHIPPGQRHRLTAIAEARVLEVSSPELDDVVRWDDDYGRAAPTGVRGQGGRGRRPPEEVAA
jgi:mannose-6-phosphate isomerase